MVYYTRAFQDFVQQVPSQRVVCFAPEGRRPEFLPGISPERLVFGGTTFLAWQGDLQGGGGRKEGINFWLTPLGIQLSGTKAACRPVQQLLQQAGFRTAAAGPDSTMQAVVTAGMTAFVAGLELSGWSLRGYRRGPWLASAARAAREAVLGELPAAGRSSAALLGTPLFRAGFSLAARTLPRLFPFDLEKYLRFHYSKTHDQTLTLLSIFLSDANSRGLPAADLQHLREALARPGSPRL
jgi:2-dehydropantoate 2-reductase